MNQEAKNYLKTECEISSFRAESLRKILEKTQSSSTKRLLAIEEEFVSLPFESFVEDLPGLLCAINIFRTSRTTFYEMYKIGGTKSDINTTAIPRLRASLEKEISLMAERQTDFSAKAARHFGRVIVILLSILSYLDKAMTRMSELSIVTDHNDLIMEISKRYESDIFSVYNLVVAGGYNKGLIKSDAQDAISRIKQLIDISTGQSDGFYEISSNKMKSKSLFGFFIPSKHSGREILRPYHLHLVDEDDFDISGLFSLDAKSMLFSSGGIEEYYKYISVIDLAKIKDNLILLDKYNVLIKKIFHRKLNDMPNIRINTDLSSIMVPASRTEDEGLKEALIEASAIFNKLIITTINS